MKSKTVFLSLLILCLFASTVFAALNDGLVAYYPFNGNANDESGNGNHGTVYGATLTTDRFGNVSNAYSFNGVNTYIDMGVLNINLPVTVSLWFNSSSINALYDTLLGWNDPEDTGIQIMGNGDGKMRFRIGSNMEDVISQSTIDGDGIWHLVTITRENDVMKAYVDGVLEVTSNPSSLIVNAHKLYFGKSFQPDNFNEYFNGKIDDVRIYNRALSEVEIQELYQGGSGILNNLVVNIAGTGSGTVTSSNGLINCGSDCTEQYDQGTSVTLTATPDAGSTFAYWDDGTTNYNQNPLTVEMNSDKQITAVFTIPLEINQISGNSIGSGVLNGRWTGQADWCRKGKISVDYTNHYENYYVIDGYYNLVNQDNPYYWVISGKGLGTESGNITFSNTDISFEIVNWANNEIKIIPAVSYSFEYDSKVTMSITNNYGITGTIDVPVMGILKSRGYGQCTWYVAKTLLEQGKCIPPSAYSITGSIDGNYVPMKWDALTFGKTHVAIIISDVTSTEVTKGKNRIITYTFEVGEMNADCKESASTYSAEFVINIDGKGNKTVLRNKMSSMKKTGAPATGYWRGNQLPNCS